MALSLRTLLIWFLVLALPLQTAAAVTMALCGPDHHATANAAEHGAAAPAAHAHPGDEAHSGHEHHATVVPASDAAESIQVVPANAHTCSVCASCCSGNAILSSMPKVVPPEFGVVAFVSLQPHISFVAASGPDRPPRSTRA